MRSAGIRENGSMGAHHRLYLPGPLTTVNFHVTHRCNLNCPCCYQKKSSQKDLSTEEVLFIVDRLAEMKINVVMISGGDPLLRNDLPQIIAAIRRKGMSVYLATNGILLNANSISKIKAQSPDLVFLGLDPFSLQKDKDPEISQTERKSLSLLCEMKQPFVINLIVTHENLPELEDAVHRLKQSGVRHVSLLRPKPDRSGEWFRRARLTSADLEKLQILRLRTARQSGLRISLDCAFGCLIYGLLSQKFMMEKRLYTCNAGMTYFHVDAAGDVYPCPYLANKEFFCGNIFTTRLREIWMESPVLKNLRCHDALMGRCGDCPLNISCRGCRALAFHDTGNVMAEDPDCPFGGKPIMKTARSLIPARMELVRFSLHHLWRQKIGKKQLS